MNLGFHSVKQPYYRTTGTLSQYMMSLVTQLFLFHWRQCLGRRTTTSHDLTDANSKACSSLKELTINIKACESWQGCSQDLIEVKRNGNIAIWSSLVNNIPNLYYSFIAFLVSILHIVSCNTCRKHLLLVESRLIRQDYIVCKVYMEDSYSKCAIYIKTFYILQVSWSFPTTTSKLKHNTNTF